MDLFDYLDILRRRWLVVVSAVLVAMAAAWFTAPAPRTATSSSAITVREASQYTATQTLLNQRDTSSSGSSGQSDARVSLTLLAKMATTGEVPQRVAARLNYKGDPTTLAARIKVDTDNELGTLKISTTGDKADDVTMLVTAFSEETLKYASERDAQLRDQSIRGLDEILASQTKALEEVETRLRATPAGTTEYRLVSAQRDALLTLYQNNQQKRLQLISQPPTATSLVPLGDAVAIPTGTSSPVNSIPRRLPAGRTPRLIVAFFVGLLLGIGLALLLERLDNRIRTKRDVERAFRLPVVAEIPRASAVRIRKKGRLGRGAALPSGWDENVLDAYGRLGIAVLHAPRWILAPQSPAEAGSRSEEDPIHEDDRLAEGPARIVLVTSPSRGEGRTTVVAGLAASFAAAGRRVVAIDRAPGRTGLAEYLGARGEDPSTPVPGIMQTVIPGVWVMTLAGNEATLGQDLVRRCLERADVVLVDGGPVLSGTEAAAAAVQADAVLVLARAGRTSSEAAHRTRDYLARLQAKVLGVALIDAEPETWTRRLRRSAKPVGDRTAAPLPAGGEEPATASTHPQAMVDDVEYSDASAWMEAEETVDAWADAQNVPAGEWMQADPGHADSERWADAETGADPTAWTGTGRAAGDRPGNGRWTDVVILAPRDGSPESTGAFRDSGFRDGAFRDGDGWPGAAREQGRETFAQPSPARDRARDGGSRPADDHRRPLDRASRPQNGVTWSGSARDAKGDAASPDQVPAQPSTPAQPSMTQPQPSAPAHREATSPSVEIVPASPRRRPKAARTHGERARSPRIWSASRPWPWEAGDPTSEPAGEANDEAASAAQAAPLRQPGEDGASAASAGAPGDSTIVLPETTAGQQTDRNEDQEGRQWRAFSV